MRVGYAKLGRSLSFDSGKWGFQGDAEAPNLLMRLARRNPDVTWVIIGKNSGNGWQELPNIENPWHGTCSGQPYNNVNVAKGPPEGKIFIPYRKGLGGFWVNQEAYARDLAVVDIIGELDGVVLHVGQHGTSHIEIPQSNTTWAEARVNDELITSPQLWSRNYGEYLTRGLNKLGDRTDGDAPVAWLITDPRNYLKARDIKWPTGTQNILAQYQYKRTGRHERYMDTRHPHTFGDDSDFDHSTPDRGNEVWIANHRYVYGGLELMILPDNWETWGPAGFNERTPIGIASTSFNDGRSGGEPRRSELIRDYMLSGFPDTEIFGKWDPVSLSDVEPHPVIRNKPEEFPDLLNRWRVTLSLPALGTSWTVSKVFQCFAANVVCFMADRLDDQGWLLPSRRRGPGTRSVGWGLNNDVELFSIRNDWSQAELDLAAWLRVETPSEFHARAKVVTSSETTWTWLTGVQRDLLTRRWNEHLTEVMIEDMLGIKGVTDE